MIILNKTAFFFISSDYVTKKNPLINEGIPMKTTLSRKNDFWFFGRLSF